ncbi:NAD(P)H dehydrogenase (quinone) [Sphingomonas gellani]|uniref:NAD(P)H dehydrogenase (Quinone) n=1 Tax=Sphingomonas gellani TaxID=1166340 RepID=A0A1H8FYL1_9SPHN|nr:NAD(P)H-dependent oxidoreductase [Sphingomonas gellani]SEN36620.1 NAD(P)H dehydrogenase (quinone) [Sphingomonas gellani]
MSDATQARKARGRGGSARVIRHLVVLGHPAADSFNHAVAHSYAQAVEACGQQAIVRDLYALGSDPVLQAHERAGAADFRLSADVEEELALLANADAVVLVYPVWSGMPPAIVTGYVDRVMGAGIGDRAILAGEAPGAVAGKQLVLLTTSAATRPWLAERGQWHGLAEGFASYLESIFAFAGTRHRHLDAIVSPLAPDYAAQCLGRVADQARETCGTLLHLAHRAALGRSDPA